MCGKAALSSHLWKIKTLHASLTTQDLRKKPHWGKRRTYNTSNNKDLGKERKGTKPQYSPSSAQLSQHKVFCSTRHVAPPQGTPCCLAFPLRIVSTATSEWGRGYMERKCIRKAVFLKHFNLTKNVLKR